MDFYKYFDRLPFPDSVLSRGVFDEEGLKELSFNGVNKVNIIIYSIPHQPIILNIDSQTYIDSQIDLLYSHNNFSAVV
jgi:hypothetical protein